MVVHPRVVQGDLKVVSMSGADSALGSCVRESGSEWTASDNPHLQCGGEDQAALAPGPMMTRQHPTGRRHSGAAAEAAKFFPPAPAADVGVAMGVGDNVAASTFTGTDEAVRLGSSAIRATLVVVDDDSTVALRYPSPVGSQLSIPPSSTSGSPQAATPSRRRISSRARASAGSSAPSSAGPPALGIEVERVAASTGSHAMIGPAQALATDIARRHEDSEARPVSPSVALQSSLLDRSYV